jgi:ketosteroid isomerase-like protein
MKHESDPLAVDHQFFGALLTADLESLEEIVADDFVLIDVMSGSEVSKEALVAAIGSGQLKFDAIKPIDARVRRYGTAAVITGHTRMSGKFEGSPFAADSRYTHVYIEAQGRWRLVSAQGTQIAGGQESV